MFEGSSSGKGVKTAGSQPTKNSASVENQMNLAAVTAGTAGTAVTAGQINPQMNLALSVAENVMGGRSPTLRCVTISHPFSGG